MYLNEKLPELEAPAEMDEYARRRVILIEALRAERLPHGHRWNFCGFGGCAVGLAKKMFNLDYDLSYDERNLLDETRSFFGLPEEVDHPFALSTYPMVPTYCVTPRMVADRLEQVHRKILRRT